MGRCHLHLCGILISTLRVWLNVIFVGSICDILLTFQNHDVLKGFFNNAEKFLLHCIWASVWSWCVVSLHDLFHIQGIGGSRDHNPASNLEYLYLCPLTSYTRGIKL